MEDGSLKPSEERLLKEAYGGGVPPTARAILSVLSPEGRAMALKRLAAVTSAGRGGNRTALATTLGVSRQTFYDLLRKWSRSGLAGLIPVEDRKPRSLTTGERYAVVAKRLLSATKGDLRNSDLARRVLWVDDRRRRRAGEILDVGPGWTGYRRRLPAGVASEPGHATGVRGRLVAAGRAVEHARRRLALDPRYLRTRYGASLILDVTATNLLVGESRDAARLAVVAIVLERASGLLVGTAIGTVDRIEDLELMAIDEARSTFLREWCDRARDDGRTIRISLHAEADPEEVERASGAASREDVALQFEATPGKLIFQTLGARVGRVALRPRFLRDVKPADFEELQLMPDAELNAHWRREVHRHNDSLFRALRSAGLAGRGSGSADADMSKALRVARDLV